MKENGQDSWTKQKRRYLPKKRTRNKLRKGSPQGVRIVPKKNWIQITQKSKELPPKRMTSKGGII
jgi:hypothetical protein